MSIWRCKVGTLHDIDLPGGADWPMRKAIRQAFADVTGQDDEFCFSGWSAELTECELAVVEDRDPVYEVVAEESPDMLRTSRADALQRALKAESALTAERERADRADLDAAICRDAIETAWRVVSDWAAESYEDAAVRRCALRKLAESVGKAAPRLMLEQPDGQLLYGLKYREWINRAKAAEAERDAQRERAASIATALTNANKAIESIAAERDVLREWNARLVRLLANIHDNLNDMPISDEWAQLTCESISTALGDK